MFTSKIIVFTYNCHPQENWFVSGGLATVQPNSKLTVNTVKSIPPPILISALPASSSTTLQPTDVSNHLRKPFSLEQLEDHPAVKHHSHFGHTKPLPIETIATTPLPPVQNYKEMHILPTAISLKAASILSAHRHSHPHPTMARFASAILPPSPSSGSTAIHPNSELKINMVKAISPPTSSLAALPPMNISSHFRKLKPSNQPWALLSPGGNSRSHSRQPM